MAPAESPEQWVGSGTVLIVDDVETVRSVAARILKTAGFDTLSAADGRQAIPLFREHADKIVAVLLDLTMQHMNGTEAFRELRRIRPDVVVILMSGFNEQDAVLRFTGKGLAGFLKKPFLPSDLIAVLRQALDRRT